MRFPTRRQQLISGLAVTLVVTVTVLAGFILALTDWSRPRTVAEEPTSTLRSSPTTVPTATIGSGEPTNIVPAVTAFTDDAPTGVPSSAPTHTPRPTGTPLPSDTAMPAASTTIPPTAAPMSTVVSASTSGPISQDMALIPTSTGTQTPLEGACNNNQSFISTPLNRTALSGVVTFSGNASIPNFSYYKLEIRRDGESDYDSFTTFLTVDKPVWHNVLGALDTRAFENGWYWIRLVVVDDTGNYPERCAWYYPIMNE